MTRQIFRTKPASQLVSESEHPDRKLKRALGPWDLTAMGIGAIIGSGIFALTGTAAAGTQSAAPSSWIDTPVFTLLMGGEMGRAGAGPAVVFSFLAAAICCAFAALCYAEFTAMVPVAGSAYTFGYASLGELGAWIIGWDLILEYAIGNVTIALSWGDYFVALVGNLTGIRFPLWLVKDHITAVDIWSHPDQLAAARLSFSSVDLPYGFAFNVPAMCIVVLVTALSVYGIRESARVNTAVVIVKIAIVTFFIAFGAFYVNPGNWHPFAPKGITGILGAAPIVFFAFIGFDAVSTMAEESRNPQRDMPIGMIASLAASSVLYIFVSLVLTGMLPYKRYFDDAAPVATALAYTGNRFAQALVNAGALAGMTTTLLVFQLGQPRIFMAMARDGLLPKAFSRIHPRFRTPMMPTILTGAVVAVSALVLDINASAALTSIGTLFAYLVVCAGIIILRRTDPGRPRAFRTPFVPWVPLIGIAMCLLLMLGLPVRTWIRFAGWLAAGIAIYVFYGSKHSGLRDAAPRG